MLEKDYRDAEKEPMDFQGYNYQKDNLNSIKKIISLDTDSSTFIVVIHFPNHKTYSFEVPQVWTTKKLLSFISSTFKPEFKKSIPTFLFHGNNLSTFGDSPLKENFQSEKVNHVIIALKNISQDNINENDMNNLFLKTNKEVFKSEEFCKMEKEAIDDYFKIFKNNSMNNFPLMNPAYNNRREQISNNSTLDKLAAFEPVPLEDFPIRNYFQLNIIFKCFISFFAFGIYIKGFNFILFLWVLIGYYWYCINNVIDDFYKKKIQEIGITEEDYQRISIEGLNKIMKLSKRGLFVLDDENQEEDSKDKNNNENKNEDKKDDNIVNNNISNIINSNINKEANDFNINFDENLKEDKKDNDNEKDDIKDNKYKQDTKMPVLKDLIFNKEDMKDLSDKNKEKEDEKNTNEKTPLLNNINDILTGNRLRGQNNNNININRINLNNFEQNNNNINRINFNNNNNNNINRINFNNFEQNNNNNIINNNIFGGNNNLNTKINEKKDNKDEDEKKDEEEENKPETALEIIWQIIKVFFLSFIPVWCDQFEVNNPLPVNNHNANQDENEENDNNNINNDNNNNNIFNNGDNNNFNNINNDFNNNNENNINMEDDSNNNKMTSSKVVNLSDDSSRDNRTYKLLKRDNQSNNENEYVFSENGGIDSLSMNSELFKQKKEKEKEKEKEKDKGKEKGKEKEIFEEDEEYVIEDDNNKQKNE